MATSLRLIVWLFAGLRFYLGIGTDKLIGRDNIGRRAVRLRIIFATLGPTFIKVAQQLSIRADLLRIEYCQELSLLLDSVPPFSTVTACKIIERAAGGAIGKVFQEFDREPIASASIACVYKARLYDGELVAIKVRRPGIGFQLNRDVRALGWLLQIAEWLGIFKPRFTRTLRNEFGRMLSEEMDFAREARNTELLRLEAIRDQRDFIAIPRVHFELSNEEVLVTDFVTGIFLRDILHALDAGDQLALERIRSQGIDLVEVARRLILSAHWGLLESLLFHADPHPANICVLPGNKLVFIDLGSCGRLTGKYRRIWQRFYLEFTNHNVQAMVRAAIAMLEPLPPIDVESFSHDIELIFWDWLFAMNSEYSIWWEKASGMLWLKFADAARRYQVPMSAEMVRIFRATFIYDTIIFRLWERLDMRHEFRSYQQGAGKRARRRIRYALRRRVEKGLTNSDYLRIEDLWHIGKQIVGRVQHYLDSPAPDFARQISKLSYGVNLILRLSGLGLGVYIIGIVASSGFTLFTGHSLGLPTALAKLARSQWLRVAIAGLTLLLVRRLIGKVEEV